MFLIIGLGNPGRKYKNTRHNIGFQTVDNFQKENGLPKFKNSKALYAFVSRGEILGKKIALAKPETFMNNSGEAVKRLSSNFNVPEQKIIVIHDDADIGVGKIKITESHGAAGHKGVESIIKALKTNGFKRIRIGIKPLENTRQSKKNFVLGKISRGEKKEIREATGLAGQAIESIIQNGIEKAMSLFNH